MSTATSKAAQVAAVNKKCTYCGQVKSSSEFYLTTGSSAGLHDWCKGCTKENKLARDRAIEKLLANSGGTKLLTPAKAAELIGVGEKAAINLFESGDIYAVDIGRGSQIHWRTTDGAIRQWRERAGLEPPDQGTDPQDDPPHPHQRFSDDVKAATDFSDHLARTTRFTTGITGVNIAIARIEGYALADEKLKAMSDGLTAAWQEMLSVIQGDMLGLEEGR